MATNIDFARQIAKFVELRSIRLCRAHIETFNDEVEMPSRISVAQQHRCSFVEENEEDRLIKVIAEFQFSASTEDGEEATVAKLDAAFLLIYEVPKHVTFDSRCLQHFADLNGAYNAWPYWRELVQTATGRIGLGGFMVPVYRPTPVEVSEAETAANPCVEDTKVAEVGKD